MGSLEVQVRKKPPKHPLEEKTPGLGDALKGKYEVENFSDRKAALWGTDLGSELDKAGNVVEDPIDKLLKSHNVQTQGGIWQDFQEKELAFWKLVDAYRWVKGHMKEDNPLIAFVANKIRTLYYARYNQSLKPDQTTVKTVVATPPLVAVGGMGGQPYDTSGGVMAAPPMPPSQQQKSEE